MNLTGFLFAEYILPVFAGGNKVLIFRGFLPDKAGIINYVAGKYWRFTKQDTLTVSPFFLQSISNIDIHINSMF